MIIRFEQLTDIEKSIMWRIWDEPADGIFCRHIKPDEFEALKNLQNFGLVGKSLTSRFKYTLFGREMMTEQKLKDRQP